MPRSTVAIIGAGLSGVALAAQLVRLGDRAPRVALIERAARVGVGLAYGTRDGAHLLNVRAGNLSLYPDAPGHFAEWLAHETGAGADSFAPRALYGAYLRAQLAKARGARLFGGTRIVKDEAAACRARAGGGWRITLKSGREIEADAVVLALGNPAPGPIAAFEAAGLRPIDPWQAHALAAAPRGDALLIGTGLTMIDAALSLAKRKKGQITAISFRGLLPRAHPHSAARAAGEAPDLPESLADALKVLRADARAGAARGEPWQWTIDRLRAQTPALWRRLSPEAQMRFLRHARPFWDVHRHRAAPDIAARIEALRAAGRLKIIAGEIVQAAKTGRGIEVRYRQRGGSALCRLDAAFAVNCTGANLQAWQEIDPLLRQLIGEGVARAHPTGLGLDVDAAGAVLGADGAGQARLYAIGPITQGAFWESTAAPEIRVAAAALARTLADDVSQAT